MAIHAFTAKQIQELTGLSERMLRSWAQEGIYDAAFVDPRPHVPYRRIYDFRDLVGLRTLALLRKMPGIDADDLRVVGAYLKAMADRELTELAIGVVEGTVMVRDRDTDRGSAADFPAAGVRVIDVAAVARQAEHDAAAASQRSPDDIGVLVQHRHILRNAWRLAGTRIPTSAIWNLTEAGYGVEDVISAYPDLTQADVEAALAHELDQRDRRSSSAA